MPETYYYLRPVEQKDLPFLVSIRNDPEVLDNIFSSERVTQDSTSEWIEQVSRDPSSRYMIFCRVESSGRVPARIGVVEITNLDFTARSAEVGLNIYRGYRRQGLSYIGYDQILIYCFDNLNLHRVWLSLLETNQLGHQIYRKIGFKDEGLLREAVFKKGSYRNKIIMSILRDEYEALDAN